MHVNYECSNCTVDYYYSDFCLNSHFSNSFLPLLFGPLLILWRTCRSWQKSISARPALTRILRECLESFLGLWRATFWWSVPSQMWCHSSGSLSLNSAYSRLEGNCLYIGTSLCFSRSLWIELISNKLLLLWLIIIFLLTFKLWHNRLHCSLDKCSIKHKWKSWHIF